MGLGKCCIAEESVLTFDMVFRDARAETHAKADFTSKNAS